MSETEKAAELNSIKLALNAFSDRHGTWETTQFLIGELVRRQKESGKITKADYAGADFRVTVTLKKKR